MSKRDIYCFAAASVICGVLSTSQFALAKYGETDDPIIKFFFDNGKKAFADKHFGDAVGWFERAQQAADRFRHDDQVLDAICHEWLGRSYYGNKDPKNALFHFKKAWAEFKTGANGATNANETRMDDLIAECFGATGDYEQEQIFLAAALSGALGNDPRIVAEPFTVPYRTERVAEFARQHGNMALNSDTFGNSYNTSKSTDIIYANAIDSMAARDRANGSQDGVKIGITKLFQLWKLHNDHGGNELNKANYDSCWSRVYGAPSGPSVPSMFPGTSSFVPGSSGFSFGSSGGLRIQPNTGTLPSFGGGSTLPHFGERSPFGGGTPYWSTTPGGNSISSPNSENPSTRPGTSTLFLPGSGGGTGLYKSPFERNAQQSKVFDSAESEGLKALDEKLKSILKEDKKEN